MSTFKFRRGIRANLPTLNQGEGAFTTDTNEFFIGTGSQNIKLGEPLYQSSFTPASGIYVVTNNVKQKDTQVTIVTDLRVDGGGYFTQNAQIELFTLPVEFCTGMVTDYWGFCWGLVVGDMTTVIPISFYIAKDTRKAFAITKANTISQFLVSINYYNLR